ncbi:DNA translocase FtsK 4TM domain-containing protein [Alistipes sp.]|uniref:DNA translocase FtsK 4TM domain-containing protein n=1 Tax=Alistipes sp. TaxID=1872444 RepID=UPI0023F3B80A|nr:DNA translocase FtsK 4TM domain-containing protein [Alistipes sp.]
MLLLFIGLFAASAVLFSFFTWSADQSGLLLSPEERATLGVEPGNLCGWAGARLGRLLVDNSFGVSGILIPVMVLLVGVRVIRQRPLLFNHSILSLFLVLILSSLTLGFAFSDKWSLCSSTGGAVPSASRPRRCCARISGAGDVDPAAGLLDPYGVFINRNFINKVNRAGNVMVDKSGRIVEIVKHKVVHAHGQPSDAAGDAAVVAAESVGNPGEACQAVGRHSGRGVCREGGAEVVVRRPEPELAVQRPVPEMPRAVRTPGPAAAGTPARRPPAAMRTTIRSWNWAPTACPLCPKPAGGRGRRIR